LLWRPFAICCLGIPLGLFPFRLIVRFVIKEMEIPVEQAPGQHQDILPLCVGLL
jgi:hypothetical protein